MLLCSRIMGYIMRRFLRTAMIVFSWFVVPYSRFTNIKVNRKKLPPIKSHLLEIPAVDLAKMIRTRKVSFYISLSLSFTLTLLSILNKIPFKLKNKLYFKTVFSKFILKLFNRGLPETNRFTIAFLVIYAICCFNFIFNKIKEA